MCNHFKLEICSFVMKLIIVASYTSPESILVLSVLNSMFRSRLVDTLVTHANTKGFGGTFLSGARGGYMPPLLKTKTDMRFTSFCPVDPLWGLCNGDGLCLFDPGFRHNFDIILLITPNLRQVWVVFNTQQYLA